MQKPAIQDGACCRGRKEPRNGRREAVLFLALGMVALLWLVIGCGDPVVQRSEDYLVRVGENVVTAAGFIRSLEVSKIAHPFGTLEQEGSLKAAKIMVLSQMIEELILHERAREMQIKVSETELEATIAAILKDYPAGALEEVLLEAAIPFEAWKAEMRNRLLMEKVIAKDLAEKIVVSPEEVSQFHAAGRPRTIGAAGETLSPEERQQKLIRRLRTEKTQEAYQAYLKALQERYRIDINQAQWEKLDRS